MVSVAELVTKLHSNIDEIHKTIALISDTSNHDAEITRLERDRDEQLQQLKMAHEISMEEGEEARLKQEQEIEEQIKREEDEIIERRKREDEERKSRIENEVKEREKVRQEEVEKRKAEFQSQHKEVEDGIDEKMERLEDELEQQMIDGQKALETLDSARREINRQIDEQLNIPTVLPKIQYKSRRKVVLNNQEPDLISGNQNSKGTEEDAEKKPITNEDLSRDVNEHKDEDLQNNVADTKDSEKDLVVEPTKDLESQPDSSLSRELVPQEQEEQSPNLENIEESSQPIEETSSLVPEEQHIELQEVDQADEQPEFDNIAQGSQDHFELETSEPAEEMTKVIDDAPEPSQEDTPVGADDIPEEPTGLTQSIDVPQNETIDNLEQDHVSQEPAMIKDHIEDSQSTETPHEDGNGDSKQDNSLVEALKEAETVPVLDPHESPEDRAAREEIAKLNEEIRRAMEEEANEAMVPHLEAKDASSNAQIAESEAPHVQETVEAENLANENVAEDKDFAEEDTLPQDDSTPVAEASDILIEDDESEPKAIPETVEVDSVPKDQVVSKSNESEIENKESLEPEVQADDVTHDPIQIETAEQVLAGEPSSEEPSLEDALNDDLPLENFEASRNETLALDEPASDAQHGTIDEMPLSLKNKAILSPIPDEDLTTTINDQGDSEIENGDILMPKEPAIPSIQEDTDQASIEAKEIHDDLEPDHNEESNILKGSMEEAIEIPLPEPVDAEVEQLNEAPEIIHDDSEPANQSEKIAPEESEAKAILTPLPEPAESESAQLNEEPAPESELLSNNLPEVDQDQEEAIEPTNTEDAIYEPLPNLTEDTQPSMAEQDIAGEESTDAKALEHENKSKDENVTPDQDYTEQIKEYEKDLEGTASIGLKPEDAEKQETLSAVSPEAGEARSIPNETFPQPTLDVGSADIEGNEDSETHVIPTDFESASKYNDAVEESTVPSQEEHYVEDTDIGSIVNPLTDTNTNQEIELPETRDIASNDTVEGTEVAADPVVTIPEQFQEPVEYPDAGTRDLNVPVEDDIATDKNPDEEAPDSDSNEISQTIDDPVQLPGHIKYRIDEPAVVQQESQPVTEEKGTVSEISVPSTENKDLKLVQEGEEPLVDGNTTEQVPIVEEVATPEPEEFEGTGEAALNLDVGSPLPSPKLQQTAGDDNESSNLGDKAQQGNPVDSKEMSNEESSEDNKPSPSHMIESVEPMASSQIPSEDIQISEKAIETEPLTLENEAPIHQQVEKVPEQTSDDAIVETQEHLEDKELPTTSIEEPVHLADETPSKESTAEPESQQDTDSAPETITSVPEISALESLNGEASEVPSEVQQINAERHDDNEKSSVNDESADVIQEEREIDETQDHHTEESRETDHPINFETEDESHISPNDSTNSEPIHDEILPQENEQPAAIESEQIKIEPVLKVVNPDILPPPQQTQHEDPEDVRAREEIARLNAEFMKAVEEEQAAEQEIRPVEISTEKNSNDMDKSELVEAEQERPRRESAEDIAAREEIAFLNEQMKLLSQQQENGGESAEIESEKEESKPQTLEKEESSGTLIETPQNEHTEEEDFHTALIQQDEHLNPFEQPDAVLSEEQSAESTTDEPNEEVEALQYEHEDRNPEDSGSEGERTEQGEETENYSESENEWDQSSEEEEEGPLPYLETIREESHDGASRVGEDHEDDDEDEEDMPKSRFFHPHWQYEDSVDENGLKEQRENNQLVSESENPAIKEISTGILQDELDHPSGSNLEVSDSGPIKRPQTPMALMFGSDFKETESPHEVSGTDKLIDGSPEAPIENATVSNATDLPRVLEPSPDIEENRGKSELVEDEDLVENNNLTPKPKPRRPASLYHRNSDLSPEHEAVFSRVSQIRSSLTPSPEPHPSPVLSPRSRSERFPPDEHRNYLDASINNAYNGWGYSQDVDQQQDYRTQLNNDNGRNRSHTVDTVPSFEHYASDDGESGPPTPPQQPQYSDPVSQQPHISQMMSTEFESSEGWSHQNDDTQDDSANQEQNLDEIIKSPNLQDAAEFDPFNPQEYKSPIPSPVHSSSFHVSNVHVDQEYPPVLAPTPPSLIPPEKILSSNAPASTPIFTAQTPTQTEEKSISQLPPNLHSVPWTQSEDPAKTAATTQEKETASPQRNPRPVSSIFARTRSLFEAGANDSNPPPKQRPLSGMSIFNVGSPNRSNTPVQTRPHSLSVSSLRSRSESLSKRSSLSFGENLNTKADANANTNANANANAKDDYDPDTDADFLPKSLDGDGRLPSPAFGLPGHRSSGSLDGGKLYGDIDDPYFTNGGDKGSAGWMGGSGVGGYRRTRKMRWRAGKMSRKVGERGKDKVEKRTEEIEERKMAKGEYKLAYVWVEGWRERLKRTSGLVDKVREEGKYEGEVTKIDVDWLEEGVGRMGT
ncbi:uncharacterized protein Bfra_005612 [Botrytis fragariae]|uniref:Uncharacterized protein n=1 Tax=Botrytis fragariae TaxID=1964551 RepID=A0A8H6AQT2_9HELO|nr:uncharacterized protein Bfra_005612 [Botrytis fragariae]KAF5872258.1 hypothetical protein Bfra_005612 [Botrytis fragariae]